MLDIPVTSQYLWKRICICQQCVSHAVLPISIMKREIALESDLGFSIKGSTKDIRIP